MPTGEPVGSTPNVGLFARAIKGKGGKDGRFVSSRVPTALFLEQLFGGRTMSRSGIHMRFDPCDFALQRLDPGGKFELRQGPEVLLHEQGQRVLRAAGKEVVLVHGGNR